MNGPGNGRSGPRDRFLAVAFLAAAALAVPSIFRYPIHPDLGWLLTAAGRVLDGARLHVDVWEVNPPLVVYMMALPVGVSRLIGGDPATWLRLIALTAALGSLVLGWRILTSAYPRRGSLFVVAALAIALIVAPRMQFGQREHLLMILAAPYLLVGAVRLEGVMPRTGWLVPVGLAAGVGFALKPYFLPMWLGVEGLLLLRLGRASLRRPEGLAILAVYALYVTDLLTLDRGWFALARLALDNYGFFAPVPRAGLLLVGGTVLIPGLVSLAVSRGAHRYAGLRDVLIIAGAAALLSLVAQGKGFPYHYLPLVSVLVLLTGVGLAVGEVGSRKALLAGLFGFPAVFLIATSWLQVDRLRAQLEKDPYHLSALTQIVEERTPGEPVFGLFVSPGFPLVSHSSATWGSRISQNWLVAGVFQRRYEARPDRALERLVHEMIYEDLIAYRPGLLLLESASTHWSMQPVDEVAFLSEDTRIRALLSKYREIATLGSVRVFQRGEDAAGRPVPLSSARAFPRH